MVTIYYFVAYMNALQSLSKFQVVDIKVTEAHKEALLYQLITDAVNNIKFLLWTGDYM